MLQDLRRGFRNQDCELRRSCSIVEDLVLVTDDHVEDRIEPVGRQLVIKIGDKTMKLRTSELRGKRIVAYRACANSDRFVEEKGLAKNLETGAWLSWRTGERDPNSEWSRLGSKCSRLLIVMQDKTFVRLSMSFWNQSGRSQRL